MKEAIQFHLDGLRDEGLPIPEVKIFCEYIEAYIIEFFYNCPQMNADECR